MAYTTIDKPSGYFNTVFWRGLYGGSDTAFTVGFQPDWIWDKRRSDTSVHALFDSVRGFGASGKVLYSNTTGAEATNALIKSVSSTGFTVTASSDNTGTLVDWCWKAGTSFTNDASATGIGTIDSAGSVSTDAGFSITSYTGTGSAGTVAHGLGSTLSLYIVKNRSSGAAWRVFVSLLGADKILRLNTTTASSTDTNMWNNTLPTSSVFSIGTPSQVNTSGENYIAYCFAEKQGYSKFGSFVGNGNDDGTFVYTGFKPAFVLQKCSSDTGSWHIHDNKRSINGTDKYLYADTNEAEVSTTRMDFLSNGFKLRSNHDVWNGSGRTNVYMAFAESPFVTGSSAIPTTAQ